MSQEGVMTQRRRVSTEYKREAKAHAQCAWREHQPDRDGTGNWYECATPWQRELRQEQHQAFTGHSRSCDEEVGHLRQ